jgi:hypothetical protein
LTSAVAASDRQRRPRVEDLRVEACRALVAAGDLFELPWLMTASRSTKPSGALRDHVDAALGAAAAVGQHDGDGEREMR